MTERFEGLGYSDHVEQFAKRQVWQFNPEEALPNPNSLRMRFGVTMTTKMIVLQINSMCYWKCPEPNRLKHW
jgi:hypothetical protein